ncbi:MAG: hypothetical protein HY699_10685 [Deltaproteobacteria bacterium]|nr:hypothetical protein [Deltaproteobacteria bacterium]
MSSRSLLWLVAMVALPGAVRAGTWSDLGPELGGRLDAIVADPDNANVLLVASPGGGVWRTQPGGGAWQPASAGLADYSVFHLEWDRVRARRLLALTWSDLYASSDLGDNWSNLTHFGGIPAPLMPFDHGADPKPFAQLRFSASESTILWGRPCSGLYYSYDGETFIQHWPFPGGWSNPDNCLQAIAADDATGRVYFSTMGLGLTEAAHVYASTCPWTATTPCLTWAPANTNLPTGITVPSLTWTGVANRLAAAMAPSRGSASTGLFVTADGNSWAATTAVPDPSWDPRPLVYAGANQLFLGTVVAYQTTDLGNSWSELHLLNAHPDTRAITPQTYEGGGRGFVWTTTDGAMTGAYANITRWDWTPGTAATGAVAISYQGLRVWQPYYIAVTGGQSPPRVFLGSHDNAGLCSDDLGASWTTNGTPSSLGCGDYASLVFAPSNPDRAYARTCSPGFARSNNASSAAACAGVSWTEVAPAGGPYPPALWTRGMTAVHPRDPDRVYFARARDVATSADAGDTLTISAPFPGDGAEPITLYVDTAGYIYAGTIDQGAFVSTDNGASWLPWGLNSPAPRAVMRIAYSAAAGGTFFMATTDGLYRRLPGGTWERMAFPGVGYSASDLEVDPDCPHRIYLALGFVATLGVHRGGLAMSNDNGTTWTSLSAGLSIHQAPIADIQLGPANSRYLYAAVYGQGGWRYDHESAPECPPLIDTPTPSPTPTASATPTLPPSATASLTPTDSPSPTASETATPAPATSTSSPSSTPTFATTSTPTKTHTATATPTVTATVADTASPAPTPTDTQEPTPTATELPAATPTDTALAAPTATATPLVTGTNTPTATALPPCTGDCGGNGEVTVEELVKGVNIALGYAALADCPMFDRNDDGEVTVEELVAGVNNALEGCSG